MPKRLVAPARLHVVVSALSTAAARRLRISILIVGLRATAAIAAGARGLLSLARDEKSGGYAVRLPD